MQRWFHGIRWRMGLTYISLLLLSLSILLLTDAYFRDSIYLLPALGLAFVLSTILGLRVAERLIRPIEEMTRAAQRMADGDFAQRIHVDSDDEISQLAGALNHMARTLQDKVHDIQEERRRLQVVLNNMAAGLLLVDARGRVRLANPSARRLLDFNVDEVGRTPIEVTKNYQLSEAIDRVLKRVEPLRLEMALVHPEDYWLEAFLSPITREDGQLTGVVVLLHDLTEARRVEAARRDFVANVSHELRTPVTSIRGFAETLLDGALEKPGPAREYVEIIGKEAARLERLVEDLLDLARIESRRSERRREEVDLAALVRRVVEKLEPVAERGKVELSALLPEDPTAASLQGDDDQLERLLVNLVENGIKYTPAGGRVEVQVAGRDDKVELVVRDTGIGIPAAALPRIFERFYRVDAGRSREKGGTGLGLAIVKHVVEAHNGRISVESREGEGSTFRITLPKSG